MKLIQFMKRSKNTILAFAIAVWSSNAAWGETLPVITVGHTDVGVNYEDGAWDLHVHAEDLGEEFEPDGVWIKVAAAARSSVPADSAYSFLGSSGSALWLLPAAHQEGLVFLGFGTEEMEEGIFTGNTVDLALKGVEGPGDFIVYINDAFGAPVVWYNSRDGFDSKDVHTLTAGGHSHVNWVFTAPGKYHVKYQASGTLASTGALTTSDVADYLFDVGELPSLLWTNNAGAMSLAWTSETNVTYQIQSRTNLIEGGWTDWGSPVQGSGSQLAQPVAAGETSRYFRLKAQYNTLSN
jgi:surface-anchored protein